MSDQHNINQLFRNGEANSTAPQPQYSQHLSHFSRRPVNPAARHAMYFDSTNDLQAFFTGNVTDQTQPYFLRAMERQHLGVPGNSYAPGLQVKHSCGWQNNTTFGDSQLQSMPLVEHYNQVSLNQGQQQPEFAGPAAKRRSPQDSELDTLAMPVHDICHLMNSARQDVPCAEHHGQYFSDESDFRQHHSSSTRVTISSAQDAYIHKPEPFAQRNQEFVFVNPKQCNRILKRRETRKNIAAFLRCQQERDTTNSIVSKRKVASRKRAGVNVEKPLEVNQGTVARVSTKAANLPQKVVKKQKPRYECISDVFTIHLPDFSQTRIRYPTQSKAVEDFQDRLKRLATYWMSPANDVSIPQSNAQRQEIVRNLVGAMKDVSRAKDLKSNSSRSRWRPDSLRKHKDEDIEAACWKMVDLVERLHRDGPSVLSIFDVHFLEHVKYSENLTFAQRIHVIAVMFCEFKARCEGFIKGGSLHTTVGAPQDALHTARSNHGNNKHRQDLLVFARENRPGDNTGKRKRAIEDPSSPHADQPMDDAISTEDQPDFAENNESSSLERLSAEAHDSTLALQISNGLERQRKRVSLSRHLGQ